MLLASGRFDRPTRVRRRVIREQRRTESLIVRTEQSVLTVLRNVVWGVLHRPGLFAKGDVSIEHRRRVWLRLRGYALLLSNRRYLGGRKKCWAAVGVYMHRETKRIRIVIGVHMPARVETALLRGESTVDTQVWMESLDRLGEEVAALRKRYPDARLDVAGDWNVDVTLLHFRTLISKTLDLYVNHPLRAWIMTPGTHGDRPIDWGWSTEEGTQCRVLPITGASDHHPVKIA